MERTLIRNSELLEQRQLQLAVAVAVAVTSPSTLRYPATLRYAGQAPDKSPVPVYRRNVVEYFSSTARVSEKGRTGSSRWRFVFRLSL